MHTEPGVAVNSKLKHVSGLPSRENETKPGQRSPTMHGSRRYRQAQVLHDLGPSYGGSDGCFPIDRLSVELLQEILSWCLVATYPHNPTWMYNSVDLQGFNPETAPLLLCRICKFWRLAALSFPMLWASLNVYVHMGKSRPSLPLASLWLSRSGALPLSLALFEQNESNDNRIAAGEILDLYKRYIHRWCNIQFDFAGPRYCRVLSSRQRSAPMLKTFRMQTCLYYDEDRNDLLEIFDSVPLLSFLHISRIPALSLTGDSVIPVPWSQLVSLSLDYLPSIGTALRILSKSPYLEECTFKIDGMDGPIIDEPVRHGLRALSISVPSEKIATFFDLITMPELEVLCVTVRGTLDHYVWPQDHFQCFLKRSACDISQLEMRDTGMGAREFGDCLRDPYLQLLKKLVVEDRRGWTWEPFVTNHHIRLLTSSFHDDSDGKLSSSSLDVVSLEDGSRNARSSGGVVHCLFPGLEWLAFRGCLFTSDGPIADMVESRWRFHGDRVNRLKRVEFDMLSSHVEDTRRLQEFSSEGLELDLSLR